MDYKRTFKVVFGGILVMMFVVIILSLTFNMELEYTNPSENPIMLWIIANVAAGVIGAVASIVYFKPEEIKANTAAGIKFGLFMIVSGFIADILLFLPYEGGLQNFFRYFSEVGFWSANLLIVISATLVGYLKENSRSIT